MCVSGTQIDTLCFRKLAEVKPKVGGLKLSEKNREKQRVQKCKHQEYDEGGSRREGNLTKKSITGKANLLNPLVPLIGRCQRI